MPTVSTCRLRLCIVVGPTTSKPASGTVVATFSVDRVTGLGLGFGRGADEVEAWPTAAVRAGAGGTYGGPPVRPLDFDSGQAYGVGYFGVMT